MNVRPVAIVGYDDAELLDIACVTTSLGMANATGEVRTPYQVTVVSPGGHPITCGPGVVLHSGQALERLTGPLDTLIISGGLGHARAAANPLVVAHVQRLAQVSRRVASVCTGASVLAAAGLLDGKRATTHWRFADALAAEYPHIHVDPDPIYIRDGRITTAAGVTSALDLTLAFIEEDHGVELARMLARDLVTYLQRPGNQAQMSIFTAGPPPAHEMVRRILDHVNANLDGDLSTTALAAVAGVSPRHLTRLFLTSLGQTPGRFIRHARTAAAARLLATTSLPLPGVAARCGFGSAETLRLAFLARYGIPPSRYRSVHKGSGGTTPRADDPPMTVPCER
ncbi:Transcriptional regulator GlxA family, contains an amidase domain and an AraC-type DNA-binding HTH domain [Micromonospora pattaloongensis]|uniref:Transcriptional regulator GlxA family, contains an amidase domain and an AraC-type DNA-binding HTH domain n=1 Tax=Micromonospora pattaloongensis TaxID=405436 RepID=A0A1H3P5P9_9ACTN|nr:DJ-1/PfpI family protein [Micromonospora pattaloongensis]SDY96418.1 Transcriptional regulator GlxA family, contains an amidase domain and an AraC-type DNA-binding HTH domain [Micromonospora pattaloongensis]